MIPKPLDALAHLAAIIASADDAIVSKDLDGTITSWNPAAERMFGYTAAEAIGRSILIIIPEDRKSEEDFVIARVREGSGVDHFETIRRHKDGRPVAVSVTISPIRAAGGEIVGASKIARDITFQRRVEHDAMRLAAIVQSSDDAIISKDLDGIIQSWNRGAEQIFGYSADETIGRSITLLIPNDRLHEETEVLRNIREGRPIGHFETVRRHKDGRLIDISLSVSPIRNALGVVIGASKIARDIGEQKRLRRVADEASRAKDEFLAVLSHELRTPLNTVLGYVRMLRQSDMPMDAEQRAKAIEVVGRNSEVLANLVNDVLDTSRLMTGKLRLAVKPIRLDEVVREALDTIQPAAMAKHISFVLDIAPGLDMVGDPDRLLQVVWNLLSNAVKFSPVGEPVTVRALKDGPNLIVQVSGGGIGIAPEQMPLIFQRFWQADLGASREHGGLGLGLALVRHFVELHGGSITAESPGLGKGATFTVRLPAS